MEDPFLPLFVGSRQNEGIIFGKRTFLKSEIDKSSLSEVYIHVQYYELRFLVAVQYTLPLVWLSGDTPVITATLASLVQEWTSSNVRVDHGQVKRRVWHIHISKCDEHRTYFELAIALITKTKRSQNIPLIAGSPS